MPTQRPFFANFLAAFRAHSVTLPKASPSLPSSAAVAASASIWTAAPTQQLAKAAAAATANTSSDTATSSPRPINTKASPYSTNTTTTSATTPPPAQDHHLVASLPTLTHNVSPQTHLPRPPPSPAGLPVYGPANKPSYPSMQDVRRSRRGSDSSSDSGGVGEKWFIGGRTAGGEEKYYKLSMVKRERSADRISADQLSL